MNKLEFFVSMEMQKSADVKDEYILLLLRMSVSPLCRELRPQTLPSTKTGPYTF